MCRCCQRCLEDFYWNCIEERFCYDESIANYNPDEDEYITKNNIRITNDNNNVPISSQPLRNNFSFSGKIHEEDYRREIQTSVPILAPEILSVFANSQIFNDSKGNLSRVNTVKSLTPNIHNNNKDKFEKDQEKLIFHLEGNSETSEVSTDSRSNAITTNITDKTIKFRIYESPPSDIQSPLSQKFPVIQENIAGENENDGNNSDNTNNSKDGVILRPTLEPPDNPLFKRIANKPLRHVQSVPYFTVRPAASENDIFSITGGSFLSISMTPEVPSISFSHLPKNYEDTPTIEKYKESVSLQSIQDANVAQAGRNTIDYSNPKYFRRTALMIQSVENLKSATSRDDLPKIHQKVEKSKRLKGLRDSLPPLTIHIPKYKKDETKQ